MSPSVNPLHYVVQRQYKDNVFIKNKLFRERLSKAKNLYRKDLFAHYGCVNAIEFSEDGEYLISGGDDKRILLWSVAGAIYDKGSPMAMRTTHGSNIFCLTFDSQNEKIFSGGNDDQVLIHEAYTCNLKTAIPHEKPVYGISIRPQNDNILATAGEDGRILVFDMRQSPNQHAQVIAQQNSGFHSVKFNPVNRRFLVTANSEEGIALWDCRKPKTRLIHYDSRGGKISGISACFDSSGKKVLALRRRLPPVLYATESENAVCQFYHPQYYNSCTMKTCCFAGDKDEYILSGSDDFNLYMWKVPVDDSEWGSSHIVLRGHRSIVNQVRYNSHSNLIASSGVEKMVKLWSSIPIGNWKGSITKENNEPLRPIYTHDDYMGLVGTTQRINHDYSDQSTNEDAKMMAFFDSLIQREIEGWDSQSDGSLTGHSDSEEEDWSKVISKIFKKSRHTADEPKKYRYNRITQLISRKKHILAKLAHNKSTSYIHRLHRYNQEKIRKRKSSKSKPHSPRKHNGIHKKSHHRKSLTERETTRHKSSCEVKPSKYFTRQSVKNLNEQVSSLDTPSTSTGITSSENSLYRVIEQDSDEEPRMTTDNCEDTNNVIEENFINILPTPLNGTRDVFINVLEVALTDSSRTNRNSSSRDSLPEEEDEDDEEAPLNGNNNNVQIPASSVNTDNIDNGFSESSDSDFEYLHTPKRRCTSVSDSGCATAPSSSTSTCSVTNLRRHHQEYSRNNVRSDEECQFQYEKFRKRVRKTRRNFAKKISAGSDTN